MYEGRWIFAAIVFLEIITGIPATIFRSSISPSLSLLCSVLSLICFVIFLFCLWFFRDPKRVPPSDSTLAVSPADGTVTLVDELEESQFFNKKMKRVSIFLSVFDVHVNRTPIAGEVLFTEGRGGLYLDARHPESSKLNESLFWAIGSKDSLSQGVGVKQITGAIARRIVPWAESGELLARGERFGMIRFGSRTDLYLPLDAKVLVAVGTKVKGGETPIARMTGMIG